MTNPRAPRRPVAFILDRRVSLTEAGRSLIAEIFPRQVAAILEEMGTLTPEEQDVLGQLCRKLGKRESSAIGT